MSEGLENSEFKLLIKGPIKDAGATSLLEVRKEMNVEMIIPCSEISISIERRIQRTIIRGLEGDDLIDEGAESAVYNIEACVDVAVYTTIMGLFRGGQPTIEEPFEGGEKKVAFKSIEYNSSNKVLKIRLIEDTDHTY
ncbi:hypothetical protein N9318_05840 [Euryarchaeota archaeon]|jgi:hypothetical protein|nr:hypothetical protein [Euryarchaeota archaeon]|tara:strand:+ start:704 stop:1117 length:414 start_codon:yes stop_codon:yes gene_type:complete